MFAYLAGCTDLAFATSILIGPQRQTALLAKQAAEVDLLCGGPLPARARHRLEQGRVRRARHAVRGAGGHSRGAGRRAARPVDRAERDGRRPLPPHPGGRPRPAAGAAADPDLDRRPSPRPRCAGWAASPTAGSPWSGRAAAWRRRSRSSARARPRSAGTCRASSSRAGWSTPPATSTRSPSTPGAGSAAGATHLSVNTMHAGLAGTDAHIDALEEMAQVLLLDGSAPVRDGRVACQHEACRTTRCRTNPTPDARPDVALRHHRQGVGPHRLHRLRRPADPHRHAAPTRRRARGLARRDRVRGRHRGDEPPARARRRRSSPSSAPGACAACRGAAGRRGLLHLPRPGRDHRAVRGVPGGEPADLGQGRGAGRRGRGGAGRAQRGHRAHPGQLAAGRHAAGPAAALGGLRRRGRRRPRRPSAPSWCWCWSAAASSRWR